VPLGDLRGFFPLRCTRTSLCSGSGTSKRGRAAEDLRTRLIYPFYGFYSKQSLAQMIYHNQRNGANVSGKIHGWRPKLSELSFFIGCPCWKVYGKGVNTALNHHSLFCQVSYCPSQGLNANSCYACFCACSNRNCRVFSV
jgi:hypothetical protein